MKITVESTLELVHANGLPVRVWTGKTERGTPIIALITRIAAPDNAPADELEVIARELLELPTRVIDPTGETIASPRSCTVCLARDVARPATHVARDADGLEWFECPEHGPTDNVAETVRVGREPIPQWFARRELADVDPRLRRREPWLPHEVITSILHDKRAGDNQSGSAFVLCAMRGAQSGWHAKHAHPTLTRLMQCLVAPGDDAAHTAWLTGFRLALGDDSESPTAVGVTERGGAR